MMSIPWWAQLPVGLAADLMATTLVSYVALGRAALRSKLPQVVATAIFGFVLTPIFVGISGLVGLSGLSSALVLLMWVLLARNVLKLDWPGSLILGLICTLVKYALVDWCGFTVLVTPWWHALV